MVSSVCVLNYDDAKMVDRNAGGGYKVGEEPVTYEAEVRPLVDWSEEEAKLIREFEIPKLEAPYPVRVNKHAEAAVRETKNWLLRHKVDTLFGAQAFEVFVKQDLGRLASLIFTSVGLDELCYGSKMVVWLFLVDHYVDDCEVGMTAESCLPLFLELNLVILGLYPDDPVIYNNLMKFVDEFVPATSPRRAQTLDLIQAQLHAARTIQGHESKVGLLGATLRELLTISGKVSTKKSNLRLAQVIQVYVIGIVEETRVREQRDVPRINDYIIERRATGGVELLWGLVDYMFHVETSDELYTAMQKLNEAHNDIICWYNDIASFKKEVLKGDVYNMVYLVSREHNMSYKEAAHYTVRMVQNRIQDLEKEIQTLKNLFQHTKFDLKIMESYIEISQNFISGNEKFCFDSVRYQ